MYQINQHNEQNSSLLVIKSDQKIMIALVLVVVVEVVVVMVEVL
jgi:hypothetical protein